VIIYDFRIFRLVIQPVQYNSQEKMDSRVCRKELDGYRQERGTAAVADPVASVVSGQGAADSSPVTQGEDYGTCSMEF
jgi:hypothetical protein